MTTKNNATKTNATKTNATKTNVNYETFYNDFMKCKTKYDLVETMKKHGFECATTPTKTKCTSDLYIQFNKNKCGDVSRLQFKTTKLLVFATDECMKKLKKLDNDFNFDIANDAPRHHKLAVANTVENFTKLFQFFIDEKIAVPRTI